MNNEGGIVLPSIADHAHRKRLSFPGAFLYMMHLPILKLRMMWSIKEVGLLLPVIMMNKETRIIIAPLFLVGGWPAGVTLFPTDAMAVVTYLIMLLNRLAYSNLPHKSLSTKHN